MNIIVALQFTYGGVFLSDPDLRYANGVRIPDKIRVDVDELHVMLFHNLATDFDVEKIKTFWCRVNKKGYYYKLENDVDVLRLISILKHGDLVDVYVVHQISEPLIVNDDVTVTPPLLLVSYGDVVAPFETDRANVSSSHPLDINEDEYMNENHPPRPDKKKAKISYFDITDSDGDSLYDVDENIKDLSDFDEDLLQARKSNIKKQAKKRYEGKLGGDNPYYDSSDPDDISDKEEGDPVDDDEVVDPLPRTSSSKIYFDKTAKKGLHLALTNLLPKVEHKWCARHIWANWKQVWSDNGDYAAKCEVRFNCDMGFEIGDPPYTHVVNVKRKQCSCRSWQLKKISCAHAIAEKDFSSSCRSQPSVQASTSTVAAAAAERDANTSIVEEMAANAKSSNRRPANAHSASKGAGRPVNAHSAPRAVGRPTNAASVGGARPVSASTTNIRPAAIVMPTTTSAVGDNATQSTTQQSTSGVGPQKRKTGIALRGGANLAYKRSRQKKLVLSGNTDRVLHNPTRISSVPTNIDLGFKLNGLSMEVEDRLSQLPEEVLVSILSKLTMEEVVATSFLSSRWRYLWKHVPCLSFNRPEIPNMGLNRMKICTSKIMRHISWINHMLDYHKCPVLEEFSISFPFLESVSDAAEREVFKWLNFASSRKIQSFNLDFSVNGRWPENIDNNNKPSVFPPSGVWGIRHFNGSFPTFNNLKRLMLRLYYVAGYSLLESTPLLEAAPYLQKFTIESILLSQTLINAGCLKKSSWWLAGVADVVSKRDLKVSETKAIETGIALNRYKEEEMDIEKMHNPSSKRDLKVSETKAIETGIALNRYKEEEMDIEKMHNPSSKRDLKVSETKAIETGIALNRYKEEEMDIEKMHNPSSKRDLKVSETKAIETGIALNRYKEEEMDIEKMHNPSSKRDLKVSETKAIETGIALNRYKEEEMDIEKMHNPSSKRDLKVSETKAIETGIALNRYKEEEMDIEKMHTFKSI
ncbi:hypothetical protein BC332_15986 [Capsicum chinense]|nr:hypothetical protein BC332_15986 [Capsicum chinense]